jgi:hypothetical protein
MANNLTTAVGVVATEDVSGVHFQKAKATGATAAATAGIAPGTSLSTIVIAANVNRRTVLVRNTGSVELRVHPSSGFAGANGWPIGAGEATSFDYTGALYIAVASGTGAGHYWEDRNA